MRKILLATTALAGVALFASSAKAGMEVTVGGYNDFRAGFTDTKLLPAGTPSRGEDFQDEFQLEVEAKAKANNGMEYGVVASLWNGADFNNYTVGNVGNTSTTGPQSNTVHVHQAYGYVNGAWGQVRMGDEHGASDFGVEAPQTYDFGGQVDGYYNQFLSPAAVMVLTPSYVDQQENSTKISYFTPKFGMSGQKFQAGVSFTPNLYDQGTSAVIAQGAAAGTASAPFGSDNYKNVFEIGGGYEGTWFDKFSTKAGFVVTTADSVENAQFGTGAAAPGKQDRDFTTWDVGAQVGYAGFTLGGNYTDGDNYNATAAQTNDQHVWDVGLSYKFDRASIAGSYLQGKGYNNFASGSGLAASGAGSNYVSAYHAYGLGAGYSLFDGMVTSVDAVFFHQEGSNATAGGLNTDGHVVILSNRISF